MRITAEQVVEVVGDAAGQLAQALQPLGLVQLALQALAFGLGLQPLPLGLGLDQAVR